MSDPQTVQGRAEERARDERVYRVTGLVDLLPDCILPPEGKDHVRTARREMLLAVRSALDAWIDRMDRGVTVRRAPTRIEIEE
jgi:hypothetical protein